MTRATLLHVLDHTSALGPAEVRELEQLAQAFPYCQTAHLLLAKAAHDQGTMLAGQRLRRAATYAADRTLLRRLIEQVAPAAAPEAAPAAVAEVPTQVASPAPAAPELFVPAVIAPDAEVENLLIAADTPPAADEPAAEPSPIAPVPEPLPDLVPHQATEIDESIQTEESGLATPSPAEPEAKEAAAAQVDAELMAEVLPAMGQAHAPLLLDVEGVEIPAAEPVAPEPLPVVEEAPKDDLPAQAPAIRPPAEAGDARFEFGLADAPPPAPTMYELPGLIDEWAASAVTRSLGSLAPLPDVVALVEAASSQPALTPAAFTGDEAVGYGYGESSRLGLSMQLLDLLTDKALAAEAASVAMAAAQPPATPLPPAGCFFEPDPLLLDHWATHCPPAPALPSSLDLINNFLRRQPRLTRPAMLPPTTGAQADLSVRSTRPEAELVSESLARILVRQGKTARAIEIYEKLMVRQPEKMAYFAAQIQQLQPPA